MPLLQLFRNNNIGIVLVLLIYLIGLRFVSFIQEIPIVDPDGGFGYFLVMRWIDKAGLSYSLVSAIIIFLQALYINRITNLNRISRDRTFYPALFFILLTAFIPEFLSFGAVVWGNLFIILALYNFFLLSGKFDTSVQMFNVGFFTAVAGIFYQPYAFFFIFFLFRVAVLKSIRFRDLVQILTGFFLTYLFAIVMAFLMDVLPEFYRLQVEQQFVFVQQFSDQIPLYYWAVPIIWMILLIVVFASFNFITFKHILTVRKKISLLYQMLFFSIIVALFQLKINLPDLLILAPCLSILLATAFANLKNQIIAEVGHVILLAVILFLHYYF